MATTSTQQTNGANTLIVSSSALIPHSSALASTQPSLIAAQNQLAQPPILQVLPHDFQLHQQFYAQQNHLAQHHPMFLQHQPSLNLQQQQNAIHAANEQMAAAKKKVTKQKIMSKSSNQLPQQQLIKSNLLTSQFTAQNFANQNNQAVVIGQLPNNVQQTIASKKMMDQHKNKQILIQNNAIGQQPLVSSQFKPTHLQSLTQQSSLINQAQLIAPIQPIPQSSQLTWAPPNPSPQLVQSPQIFIRQPTHTTTDGQLFIQGSNPALQAMPGTPFYVNNTGSIVQLLSNHTNNNLNNLNASVQHQQILHAPNQTATSTTVTSNLNTSSANKLKAIKPASQNNTSQSNSSQKTVKPMIVSEKKSKKESIEKANKFSTKSTQQMNAEMVKAFNEKNKLQRSDSLKSLDSIKSKSEIKLKKQISIEDDSNSMSNHTNGSIKKSEKKIKQKAIVKPQILSHCVDGYIIHESSYPFPVNVTEELNDELEQIKLNNNSNGNLPSVEKSKSKKLKKLKLKTNQSQMSIHLSPFKNDQLDSSPDESTQNESNNLNSTVKMQNKNLMDDTNDESSKLNKERKSNVVSVAPINESSNPLDESNIHNWTVDQTYEYLIKQDVSEAIAKELHKHQIDGRSLVLLTVSILKDKLMFKLGPTLSLNKKIVELKEKSQNSTDNYLPPCGDNIYDWSVDSVFQFILNITSNRTYADEFKKQEMDGHSLTLISEDNIVNDIGLPLGPAILIYNRIEELKKKSSN